VEHNIPLAGHGRNEKSSKTLIDPKSFKVSSEDKKLNKEFYGF